MASSKSLTVAAAVAALMAAAKTAGHPLTQDAATELVRKNSIKSMKRVNETAAGLGRTPRYRSERVIEQGKRGFNFTSPVWQDSIRTQTGIAVHPSNVNKLKQHAKEAGVSSAGNDRVAIAKAIAATLG